MYEAKINGEFEYNVSREDGELFLNGISSGADIHRINGHTFQVLHKGGSYTVHLLGQDADNNSVTLSVNGKRAEVKLTTELERLLKRLGMEDLANAKVSNLKAPMPGLIHSILVEVGAAIEKGEPLIILEAMKMENVLKSPTDGTVKKILVQVGESVEKGKILMEFD